MPGRYWRVSIQIIWGESEPNLVDIRTALVFACTAKHAERRMLHYYRKVKIEIVEVLATDYQHVLK